MAVLLGREILLELATLFVYNVYRVQHKLYTSSPLLKFRDLLKENLTFYVVFTAAPCNQHIIAATADGRPMTTRMPEMAKTIQQQYKQQQGRQQHIMDANNS
jgi:hypothetical protein